MLLLYAMFHFRCHTLPLFRLMLPAAMRCRHAFADTQMLPLRCAACAARADSRYATLDADYFADAYVFHATPPLFAFAFFFTIFAAMLLLLH